MGYRKSLRRRREQLGGTDFQTNQYKAARQKRRRVTEKKREKVWRAKFTVEPIIYRAQNGNPRDVRTFLFDTSHILEAYVDYYDLKGYDDEDTMWNILLFVIDHLRYVGDQTTKGQPEFWQNPEDTIITMRGDCEDGAILIKSLALVAGIPDWKVKIMAGMVVGGGHAYCTYIRHDETQVILDWCYWPNKKKLHDRPDRGREENYLEVWFSFDKRYGYAPKPTEYGNSQIKVSSFKVGG
jgi:predicted transglutaminase-like cysteine proteinase